MRSELTALCVVLLISGGCAKKNGASAAASASAASSVAASSAVARDASRGVAAPADVAAPPANAEVTPSGVASIVLAGGQGGAPPVANDCVRARYVAWKRDGSLHADTSRDAAPTIQCLRRAMPGLAEIAERMTTGEQRRIWIPGKLTYQSKDPSEPAPQDDLTVDLTLLEILRAPATPPDLRAPPANAQTTKSGLRMLVLAQGLGKRNASPNERMTVRFSGWTLDGALFETTELEGRPASVTRADISHGEGEALSLMQIGEKARVWIPAALAFGDKPRRGLPAGDLVYDLELLAVQ